MDLDPRTKLITLVGVLTTTNTPLAGIFLPMALREQQSYSAQKRVQQEAARSGENGSLKEICRECVLGLEWSLPGSSEPIKYWYIAI